MLPNPVIHPVPPSLSSPDHKYLHTTTSYTQIDDMLEKMLHEVERQEKLFHLDLDVLEPDDDCINTIELMPATDALIEVPIKKSKPKKMFETTHELQIIDNNDYKEEDHYEMMSFGPKSDDLIDLDDDDFDDSNYVDKPYNYELMINDVRRASNESLNDDYPDSWDDPPTHPDGDDNNNYETVENRPLTYSYQLHDNRTGNDIWWEGTYRNLSIVPEEDEENVSLLGSYSSKNNCHMNSCNVISSGGRSSYLSSTSVKDDSTTSTDDDDTSGSVVSSDEGHYETCEKIVKAEVKLLVKTTERGKEAIEIRSVREFMENAPPTKLSQEDKAKKSQTLPISKFDDTFSKLSRKFSSILDSSKKKSQSYSPLMVLPSDEDHSSGSKPTFTLQRLFLRNPSDNLLGDNNNTNLMGSSMKQLSRSRTELVAQPSDNFPLNYDHNLVDRKVDLYANIPFYPCYNQTVVPLQQYNPFTEFISNPFHNSQQPLPVAYCDWLPQSGDHIRGKVNKQIRSVTFTNSYAWVLRVAVVFTFIFFL